MATSRTATSSTPSLTARTALCCSSWSLVNAPAFILLHLGVARGPSVLRWGLLAPPALGHVPRTALRSYRVAAGARARSWRRDGSVSDAGQRATDEQGMCRHGQVCRAGSSPLEFSKLASTLSNRRWTPVRMLLQAVADLERSAVCLSAVQVRTSAGPRCATPAVGPRVLVPIAHVAYTSPSTERLVPAVCTARSTQQAAAGITRADRLGSVPACPHAPPIALCISGSRPGALGARE